MDINILDNELNHIAVIDNFSSLMCCKRYYDIGALDLQIEATTETINAFKRGYYITRDDDDTIYRIEALEIDTSTDEDKNFLIVGAYDAKKILSQRIIWSQLNFKGTVEDYIRRMITDAIIDPSVEDRKIDNFIIKDRHGYEETTSEQVTYDNLAEKIIELCKTYGYGWKVTLENGNFCFDLFKGNDKSVSQTILPPVVFSPEFENFYNSKYVTDGSQFKNVVLSAGEGEGISRRTQAIGTASGLDRYEMFVDAKGISSDTEDPTFNYDEALTHKGVDELAKLPVTTSFEGEVDISSYNYKTDYDLGDVVTLQNEYGIGVNARITEIIETWDMEGYTIEPKFDELSNIQQPLATPNINVYELYNGKRASFSSYDTRVTFHYTTDGSVPTASSPSSISVDLTDAEGFTPGTYTINLITVRNDEVSPMASLTVSLLKAVTPTFSVSGIEGGKKISWESANATTMRYSTTGDVTESSPSGSSYEHKTAGDITVRVKAWRNGYLPSEQASQSVTLNYLETPTFAESSTADGKIVSFSCAGASYFRYTTDGSSVSDSSSVGGSVAITTAGNFIVKVKAYGNGYLPSAEASYTVTVRSLPTISFSDITFDVSGAYARSGVIYLDFTVSSEVEYIYVNAVFTVIAQVKPYPYDDIKVGDEWTGKGDLTRNGNNCHVVFQFYTGSGDSCFREAITFYITFKATGCANSQSIIRTVLYDSGNLNAVIEELK